MKLTVQKEVDNIVLEDRVAFNQLLRQLVVHTLNYKADLYDNHILYQQQRARNGPAEYKQYLSLLIGKSLFLACVSYFDKALETC